MHRQQGTRFLLVAATMSLACSRHKSQDDPAFAAMQTRGAMAMGVDQYTSTHKFDMLADGGRIELQRDVDDTLGVAQIRAHMKMLLHSFEAGDFSTPGFVHMKTMPGTTVMATRRAMIAYAYRELPRGAELRITTSDSAALGAIHEFMAAQRDEHHAMGSDSGAAIRD
jgi:hypothetical protein